MYTILEVNDLVGDLLKLRDEFTSIITCVREEKCSMRFVVENLEYVEAHLVNVIEKHVVKSEEIK